MKTTNFIHRHWIMASYGLATDTRRTVCQGFVTAATNYRASCHELSCQLPQIAGDLTIHHSQLGIAKHADDSVFRKKSLGRTSQTIRL